VINPSQRRPSPKKDSNRKTPAYVSCQPQLGFEPTAPCSKEWNIVVDTRLHRVAEKRAQTSSKHLCFVLYIENNFTGVIWFRSEYPACHVILSHIHSWWCNVVSLFWQSKLACGSAMVSYLRLGSVFLSHLHFSSPYFFHYHPFTQQHSLFAEFPSFRFLFALLSRSRWPRGLRRRSAAVWLLGSRVRIPLRAAVCLSRVFICCVVLCR
jgi:hypothetical protein